MFPNMLLLYFNLPVIKSNRKSYGLKCLKKTVKNREHIENKALPAWSAAFPQGKGSKKPDRDLPDGPAVDQTARIGGT